MRNRARSRTQSATSIDIASLGISDPPPPPHDANSNDISSKHALIISPHGCRYRRWSTLIVFITLLSMWLIPFEIAFLNFITHHSWLFIANYIIDGLLAIDVLVTFLVAYIDQRTQLPTDAISKIASRYLCTWFAFDVASIIPLEIFYPFRRKGKALTLFAQVLGLLKFFRFRRVIRFFDRVEKDIRFNYFFMRCLWLLTVTLLSVHFAGCSYFMLAECYPNQKHSWLTLVDGPALWERYIAAVYWSVSTFTTVGYGDIHAVNSIEMVISSCYMIFNLVLSSYLIGSIGFLVLGASSHTMGFRMRIQAASRFASKYQLPSRITEHLFTHLYMQFEIDNVSQQQFLKELPKHICQDVYQHLFLDVVKKVYLFKGFSDKILAALSVMVEVEYVPPNERVIEQGEDCENVYLIVSGEVQLTKEGTLNIVKEHSILGSGNIFGEEALIERKPHCSTVQTTKMCQLLKFKGSILLKKIEEDPAGHQKISKNFKEMKDRDASSVYSDARDVNEDTEEYHDAEADDFAEYF